MGKIPLAKRDSGAGSRVIVPWHEVWDNSKMTVFGTVPVHPHDVFTPLGISLSAPEEQRLSRAEHGYVDEKTIRDDVSDIVFVPSAPEDLEPETRRSRTDLAERVLFP
jgi:hypothetical protein